MRRTNFVNLCPHTLTVAIEGNVENAISIEPSGAIARVKVEQTEVNRIDGEIPVRENVFGEVENLPEPSEDTVFIVSAMVLSTLKGIRPDVVGPDSGPSAIRNEKGQIVAVTGFVR